MNTPLLTSRRFLPLFLTQMLGALNDNLFKNAFALLVIFGVGQGGPELVAIAGGVFILPYALFSAAAGGLADRFDKARLIRLTKLFELLLMAGAAVALATANVPALLAVLFGLGVQATFFGPLKYGILPDHLDRTELLRGNGLIEAGTFAAILVGTIAGGVLIGLPQGARITGACGLVFALAGLAASWRVPPAPPAARPAIDWNILRATIALLRDARANRAVWLSILGLSWFWTLGATFLAEFPVLAQHDLGAGNGVVTLMLACFAIGIGLGSVAAGRLLHGAVSARHVPFAALAISLFALLFAWCLWPVTPAFGWHGIPALLTRPRGALAMFCLLATAASGGVFSVPLYALIQERAGAAHRARMIAANNVANAVGMVLGAGVLAGLAALLSAPAIIAIAALLNLAVAVLVCGLLPKDVALTLCGIYFRLLHGVALRGVENLPPAGTACVITPNHQSFLDGCLLACVLPGEPVFAVDRAITLQWWARPFLAPVDVLPVDPANPYAVREMVRVVQGGRKLVIFPEGRITRTGGLMKMYDGAGLVAERAGVMVVPVRIEGLQFSPFSRMRGKLRLRWFPRLSVTVLPPVTLAVDPGLQGHARRRALGLGLEDAMVGAEFATRPIDRTLFAALLDAAAMHGMGAHILDDAQAAPLTYRRLLLGAVVLGRRLAAFTEPGEIVGLMLPNASGALVTFMALQAEARVPAMLNHSAGADAMAAACAAAGIRRVLTSRAFVEAAKLEPALARLERDCRITWLDDARAGIGKLATLRGMLDLRGAWRRPGAGAPPASPAVVLFTSGSEGAPKGVVLSHRNILANCAQIAAVVDFSPADRVLNAMPMFHAFGLTGGTLLPLLNGVPNFLYPSPLHYRTIPELAYAINATIAFGTDTFLAGWARFAHAYDLRAMRVIFAGAERVREETRRLYADRFGVRVLEGYGATETSPVLALNTPMHNRPGSVGRLLPGIEARLEPVPGIAQGGRLLVRGPNVMLGYLLASAPGALEAPEDGWYDTGDIVEIDADRFVTISGRAKRFAKIGGEMVSMAAAEQLATALWPEAMHAVVSLADARKGETLLLLTTQPDATASALLAAARAQGIAEIMLPRAVRIIKKLPLLGSGKIDYPASQHLAASARDAAE